MSAMGLFFASIKFALKALWICVVISLAIVLILIALVFSFKGSSSEVASWVQAVGSIAAIWGAFSISNRQVKRQLEQKKIDDEKKRLAYFAVVKSAADHALSVGQMAIKNPPGVIFKLAWSAAVGDLLETSMNSLKVLPTHELGSYELVIAHVGITGAISNMLESSRRFVNSDAFAEQETSILYENLRLQHGLIEMNLEKFKLSSAQQS